MPVRGGARGERREGLGRLELRRRVAPLEHRHQPLHHRVARLGMRREAEQCRHRRGLGLERLRAQEPHEGRRRSLIGQGDLILYAVACEPLKGLGRVLLRRRVACREEAHERRDASRARNLHLVGLVPSEHRERVRRVLVRTHLAGPEQLDERRDPTSVRDGHHVGGASLSEDGERTAGRALLLDTSLQVQHRDKGPDRTGLQQPCLHGRICVVA